MRVNLRARDRDRTGPLVVRENQSRRDLTKVAQYPAAAGREMKQKTGPSANLICSMSNTSGVSEYQIG